MSLLNAYWVPPQSKYGNVSFSNPKFGDLGFRNDLVWPMPATVGAEYFSEGKQELPLEKSLNKTVQGEYFSRGGMIPSSGGVPLINPYSKTFTHSRLDYEVPFSRPTRK